MDAMWREKRKVIAHNFSPKALDEKHYRIQEAEFVIFTSDSNSYANLATRATVLLNDLLRTPDEFFDCVRRYTASVAAILVFGQRGATFKSFWAHVRSNL
jgi:hypothetical protein